jgi:hypothetical protein
MLYQFNPQTLRLELNKTRFKILVGTIVFLLITSFSIGRLARFKALDKYEHELLIVNLETEKKKFTKDKLVNEIKRLNIKFPHIVMAQSIIETRKWTSNIFKESNNLFGMKEAKTRISTAKGTQYNHAYYEDWYQSVYDYAFYQTRYLGGIKNEEEYFNYLSANYAEDKNYVAKIKMVIEKEKLKGIF